MVPLPFGATLPLRRELRPAATDEELGALYDAPGALHLGVLRGKAVLAVATAFPAPLPEDPTAWRVRGVVVTEALRSQGFGAALMSGLLSGARAAGAGTVWLTARAPAEQFYLRLGFVRVGRPWVDPEVGPHVEMRLSPTT